MRNYGYETGNYSRRGSLSEPMRLPPASNSSVKDMIIGVEITLFGFVFIYQSYLLIYSSIIGDIIVFLGLWITISGYYSDKGTDTE